MLLIIISIALLQRMHCCAEWGFRVNLPTATQKTQSVLEFCIRFGNGMSLPHSMNFSYLQHAWDTANLTFQDLMSLVVNCAVDPNNRSCPICLNPVLLRKFGIPDCGHPMHMKCWRAYRNQMYDRDQVVACPVCKFDTRGYCYQVRLWSIGKLRGWLFRGIVSKEIKWIVICCELVVFWSISFPPS